VTGAFVALALARGTALFIGIYSLANAVATMRGAHASQNLWWIDPSFLPTAVAAALVVGCGVALLAYGLMPRTAVWRRALTVVACVLLAGVALQNVSAFYLAWGAASFHPGVAVPLSLVIAVVCGLLGWAVVGLRPSKVRVGDHIAAFVGLALVVALFPLAQVGFFGTSDYRAKADAAVVFGARAFSDGTLSPSLRDRVVTGVGLYKAGLVHTLVMSGARGESGIDEPVAMRDAAVRAGVPSSAILLDSGGVNTDATVKNTTEIFKREGIHRVLAVSQGYHLPRVKLAYLAAGWDVRTVPAAEIEPIWGTPLFVARELPGFWTYWLRSLVRDVRGS
jgi:vancomycin permeability regulator SanA